MKFPLTFLLPLLIVAPMTAAATDTPVLTVEEPGLGSWTFTTPTGESVLLDIAAGQPLNFRWSAEATHYGGTIDGYRYGWDVVDPSDPNDPGWATEFEPDLFSASEQSFTTGTHTLHVVVRDAAGATTTASFALSARCPVLTISEPALGDWVFTLPFSPVPYIDVPAGALMEFSWIADASEYGGSVVGYRYGWDLIDPGDPDDPGWATGFQPDLLSAPPISFAPGEHRLHVLARDAAGAMTLGCLGIRIQGGVAVTAASWGRVKADYGR